jgi:hypothetical protein
VSAVEVHHTAPRCLLRLWDEAQGELRVAGVGAWLEFEHECRRWNVPVEIDRESLERLVEASTEVLEREKHRLVHANDWQRWGRRGGLSTVRRYGTEWMSALALKRWGRISADDLASMRFFL